MADPPTTEPSITLSPKEVYDALVSLDPSKLNGTDSISPSIFLHCAPVLYEPFTRYSVFVLASTRSHYTNIETCTHDFCYQLLTYFSSLYIRQSFKRLIFNKL